MGFNFNGIPGSEVTINGSVLSGESLTLITGVRTSNGTTTLGTVPANKKWKIKKADIKQEYYTTSTASMQIKANGNIIAETYFYGASLSGSAAILNNDNVDFGNDWLELSAGQTVTFTVSNARGTANVYYIEEDA